MAAPPSQMKCASGRLTSIGTRLEDCFHLPLAQASHRLQICPTLLKKICRKEGIARWPARQARQF